MTDVNETPADREWREIEELLDAAIEFREWKSRAEARPESPERRRGGHARDDRQPGGRIIGN